MGKKSSRVTFNTFRNRRLPSLLWNGSLLAGKLASSCDRVGINARISIVPISINSFRFHGHSLLIPWEIFGLFISFIIKEQASNHLSRAMKFIVKQTSGSWLSELQISWRLTTGKRSKEQSPERQEPIEFSLFMALIFPAAIFLSFSLRAAGRTID